MDSSLLDKTIKFAVDAHANTERRGKGFPYIVHPMEAMSIVATITSDQEMLAAAALHDTVEDTDVTIEIVREEFGERIAALVDTESEKPVLKPGASESDTWRERKQAAIDRLSASSRDSKIVAMGDKLSNMRAIAQDFHKIGDKIWDRFHAPGGVADHEWHYRGLARALQDLAGTEAYGEFTSLIEDVFGRPRPELIDINDYEESGDGFTAISYNSKQGCRMIKLYSDFIPFNVPEKEMKVNRTLLSKGLPIPMVYRMVTDGDRVGVEFERIMNKRSFSRAISQEPDKLEEYTVRFTAMCKHLHSIECDTTLFDPVELRFLKAVNECKSFSDTVRSNAVAFIKSIPPATTCIHGDLHIGNALMAGDKLYWIDLADFAYGNPLFDIGMLYFVSRLSTSEEMSDKIFHLSCAQMCEIWSIFVREYFGPGKEKEINAFMDKMGALYMIFFDCRDSLLPGMPEFVNEQFS